jgi:redox-sensing transcriptional repressor
VRKDLSYFGTFGKRGAGYNVSQLVAKIAEILGISEERKVIIVGAGNLGSALAAYHGFEVFGFKVCALFDTDTHKTGKKIKGIPCYNIKELIQFVKNEKIKMAVIAVPAQFAQQIASVIVSSNIKAILNFAPVRINIPPDVKVNNVDLALELKSLSYFLKNI